MGKDSEVGLSLPVVVVRSNDQYFVLHYGLTHQDTLDAGAVNLRIKRLKMVFV